MNWIASLPMYGFAPQALNSLWEGVARHLRTLGIPDVPERLTQAQDPLLDHWLQSNVLLSQTCGFPLASILKERVAPIGVFNYRAKGCEGVRCASQIVVHARNAHLALKDFRGATVAYNSDDSQSGYNSLRALVAPLAKEGKFFGQAIASGSHFTSMQWVLEGRADIAAIDAVTLAGWAAAPDNDFQALAVIEQTDPYPGLPLICANTVPPDVRVALDLALRAVMVDPELEQARDQLLIQGYEPITVGDYAVTLQMRDRAQAYGVTGL